MQHIEMIDVCIVCKHVARGCRVVLVRCRAVRARNRPGVLQNDPVGLPVGRLQVEGGERKRRAIVPSGIGVGRQKGVKAGQVRLRGEALAVGEVKLQRVPSLAAVVPVDRGRAVREQVLGPGVDASIVAALCVQNIVAGTAVEVVTPGAAMSAGTGRSSMGSTTRPAGIPVSAATRGPTAIRGACGAWGRA